MILAVTSSGGMLVALTHADLDALRDRRTVLFPAQSGEVLTIFAASSHADAIAVMQEHCNVTGVERIGGLGSE